MSADDERTSEPTAPTAPADHPELETLLSELRAFIVSLPAPDRALFVERLEAMIRTDGPPA